MKILNYLKLINILKIIKFFQVYIKFEFCVKLMNFEKTIFKYVKYNIYFINIRYRS